MSKLGIVLIILFVLCPPALARWPQVAEFWKGYELTPGEKQWMGSVKNPKSGYGCCGDADGIPVEWEIRGDHYWGSWDGGWHEIPDDAVIKDGHARFPVMWLTPGHKYIEGKDTGYRDVRCFWPGPAA